MPKNKSEERTGLLLKRPDTFVWAFKPVDSPFYGGQTRIDWMACDIRGRFWLVEVKSVGATSRSFNLDSPSFISSGQKIALRDVAKARTSVSLLIVWQGNTMYVFDWRRLQWRYESNQKLGVLKPGMVRLDDSDLLMKFGRKKTWAEVNLYEDVQIISFKKGREIRPARKFQKAQRSSSSRVSPGTRTTKRSPGSSSPRAGKLTSTSRQTGSTPITRTKTSKPSVRRTAIRKA